MNHSALTRSFQFLCGISLCLTLACGAGDDGPSAETEQQSLNEMIQVGQQVALNRNNIDWDAVTQRVNDTYAEEGFDEAVVVFLDALNDKQSLFARQEGFTLFPSNAACTASPFDLGDLPDDVGFIDMRTFVGSAADATLYAGDRHNRARSQDRDDLKGWVLDLSDITAGEIFPQVAALGFFFDRETLGYLINSNEEIPWGYTDGKAYLRNTSEVQAEVADPYTLLDPNGKLVVITDLTTASPGEAVVLALSQRPNTLILGRPTCGKATVAQSFSLSNGDFVVISTFYLSDSERNTFPGRIDPDIQVGNSNDLLQEMESFFN